MKKISAVILSCVVALSACESQKDIPNTDIEVASAFVKYILQNDFKDAEKLVLPGEANEQYLSLFKKFFEAKSAEELKQYKEADFVVNEIIPVNDSVTVVDYSNSYKRTEKSKLKVVKLNGQWLVDLKDTK